MDINQVKEFIEEMFPHVNNDDVDYLIRTNSNVDMIVTKILTNEYKGFKINLKELVIKPSRSVIEVQELYYPEIFNNNFIDEHIDIQKVREEAQDLYKKANEYSKKGTNYKTRQSRDYYNEEINELIEKAKRLDRKAALVIIKKSISNPHFIDLHGLYVQEALMFLNDFVNKIKPKKFNVITGQEKIEGNLRPSVISLLKKRNYIVIPEGPYLHVKRSKLI